MLAMVIDDSRTTRAILAKMLRKHGFEIIEAENGQDAVTKLQDGPRPSLALVDWRMPYMDGFEFLKRVRNDPKLDPEKVMMVTTKGGVKEISRALRAGADEYMFKPFSETDFRSKLETMGVL